MKEGEPVKSLQGSHNQFKFISDILLTLLCTRSLSLFTALGTNPIWVLLFFSVYFIVRKVHGEQIEKRVKTAGTILGVLFALFTTVGFTLTQDGGLCIYWENAFDFIGLSIFLSFALTGALQQILKVTMVQKREQLPNRACQHSMLWDILLFLLCWFPYFLACYPGNVNKDAFREMRSILGMSQFTNHHPVIHQLMIGLCLKIGSLFGGIEEGVVVYSVVQSVLLATAFAYALRFMKEKGISRIWRMVSRCFFALFPIHAFYSVTMYKNVPFAIAALFLVICLIKELQGDYDCVSRRRKVLAFSALTLSAFFFCAMRNNGYYAFLLSFIILIILNKKRRKRLLAAFLLTVVFVQGYQYVIFDVFHAEKTDSSEMLCLPLQMIARVVKQDDPDLTSSEFITLGEVLPDYEKLAEYYSETNADALKSSATFLSSVFGKNPLRYFAAWLKVGLKYPRTYIDAFLLHTQSYWDPALNSSCITPFIDEDMFDIHQKEVFVPLKSALIVFWSWIGDRSTIGLVSSMGFLVMIYVFLGAVLLLRGQKAVAGSLILLGAVWLTTVPAPVYMYHYLYSLPICFPIIASFALNRSESAVTKNISDSNCCDIEAKKVYCG